MDVVSSKGLEDLQKADSKTKARSAESRVAPQGTVWARVIRDVSKTEAIC